MDDEEWEKIGYILASTYRRKVILALKEGPLTPKQLSQLSGIGVSHVSNVLNGLRTHDLVKCLNPKMRKGRLYEITPKGQDVLKFLLRVEELSEKTEQQP